MSNEGANGTAVDTAMNNSMTVVKTVLKKPSGFDYYRTVLQSPRYIVAPMVQQSEYAWRILSKRYGAQLCYTPMFHARLFAEQPKYRRDVFSTGSLDRPLIVQFCANDANTLLSAAKLVENDCDGIDLNLGCPQGIAKKGHYGSFLQDEWSLIAEMVKVVHENISVPITCKIRVFPDVNKTIAYAKMIQDAGCQMLTVHGRVRDQKGQFTGLADWDQIKKVKEALSIPVISNGNILYFEDVERCIAETGVDGVMTAEGNLYNPAIFSGKHLNACDVAQEYLDICRDYPRSSHVGSAKPHLFKMLHMCLKKFPDMREVLGRSNTFEKLQAFVDKMKTLIKDDVSDTMVPVTTDGDYKGGICALPYWILQPYIRPDASLALERQREQHKHQQQLKAGEQVASNENRDQIVKVNALPGEQTLPIDMPGTSECAKVDTDLLLVERVEKRHCPASPPKTIDPQLNTTQERLQTTGVSVKADTPTTGRVKRICRGDTCRKCVNLASPKCVSQMCKNCCRKSANGNGGDSADIGDDGLGDGIGDDGLGDGIEAVAELICKAHSIPQKWSNVPDENPLN
ncbi:hypothetical protein BASA61_009924 [Batrachochytrium salamandrivorans]|nr:hypothetical protein BASA61_009924 [Batrachochytrium salamandrivorans]